ncbi:SWFGD domain-containing protein [Botryobacter ruber]|uniref:SWFGD domain-containing protein n=1 Tax=Botryobacter ruber TaxID=2171629 RepID=UPI000E0B94DD|nr:SWFGD domain-containing protein [Botryobacter ruber]
MRSYENSGYNPYNDNDRTQSKGSSRNYYSGEFDINSNRIRGAHDRNRYSSGEFGTGRDTFSSSGHGNASTYGHSNLGTSRGTYGTGSSNWGNTSNYGSSGYGTGSTYGTSGSRINDYRSTNRYGNRDSWDRTTDRMENAWDRAGDRMENAWERTKNKASNAWDRMTDDDDTSSYSHRSSLPRNYNTYGSSGSYTSNDYYNRNRGFGHDRDFDRDRHEHDRGFFDRAGDEVKSWFGDEDAERRRRMDEMRDRQEDRDYNNYRRTGSTSFGNTYSGPPYSYGSSSRRDYEW